MLQILNPNPTYGTGFARKKAESASPWMWDGLVGAWAPFLGPSGQLMDWSEKRHHGELTNMDATDWQGDALNFPGTNEYVDLSTDVATGARGSILAWINDRDAAASPVIFACADTVDFAHFMSFGVHNNSGALRIDHRTGATTNLVISTAFMSEGVWTPIALTGDGTIWRMYIKGIDAGATVGVGSNLGLWFDDLVTPVDNCTIGTLIRESQGSTFNGSIRNVLLYNRVLSPAEILQYSETPKGLFIPRRRVTYFVPAAVGVVPQIKFLEMHTL